MKLFTVKETRKMTGLSRKQLYDYQVMVPPDDYDKSGYKLYNSISVDKLKTISDYRRINMPLKDIKEVMEGKVDTDVALKRQIEVLKKQDKEVRELIKIAEYMLNNWK